MPMQADAANAPRCQDRAGPYEAWYVPVADPEMRRGFWIRYPTLNPARGAGLQAQSALWAFAFDRDHPEANWGGKVDFPLRALQTSLRPFRLRLEGATLEREACSGQAISRRRRMRWVPSLGSRQPPVPFLRHDGQ